jgi:hypothetical protein
MPAHCGNFVPKNLRAKTLFMGESLAPKRNICLSFSLVVVVADRCSEFSACQPFASFPTA